MTRALRMIGGLLIWAAHFIGLYAISSAADVWSSTDAPGVRWAGLAFSLACLFAVIAMAGWIGRGRLAAAGPEAWERRVGLTGVLVAGVGVFWQTVPLAF